MNRQALRIAREVADDTGTLMAGNICNSTVYQTGDKESIEKTKAMFKGPIAAVPVPYRTTSKQPTFFSVTVPGTG
ncbi:hypothetical protein KUTeg_001189 [Tegillarca granosa]|uniref:Uncharacterized protein n=1 Tax=Tegillarca granosa TaxID=220873 RepID=A0ABQ9FX76_TEGGR|nr:hypothetical protein KUTeg_001189 [Tegillarca granosa]